LTACTIPAAWAATTSSASVAEIRPRRQRGEDARAIGGGVGTRHHRRHEVRHDEGAREIARRMRHHRSQHRAVAQMQVKVVRSRQGQGFGHAAS
jgi:predicted secreted Zn-dependent protease